MVGKKMAYNPISFAGAGRRLIPQQRPRRVDPRQEMAKQLMSGGDFTSPIHSNTQGFARIAEGAVRGYFAKALRDEVQGDEDKADKMVSNAIEMISRALPEPDPETVQEGAPPTTAMDRILSATKYSDNPVAHRIALELQLQQAGKGPPKLPTLQSRFNKVTGREEKGYYTRGADGKPVWNVEGGPKAADRSKVPTLQSRFNKVTGREEKGYYTRGADNKLIWNAEGGTKAPGKDKIPTLVSRFNKVTGLEEKGYYTRGADNKLIWNAEGGTKTKTTTAPKISKIAQLYADLRNAEAGGRPREVKAILQQIKNLEFVAGRDTPSGIKRMQDEYATAMERGETDQAAQLKAAIEKAGFFVLNTPPKIVQLQTAFRKAIKEGRPTEAAQIRAEIEKRGFRASQTTFPTFDADGRPVRGYLDVNNKMVLVGYSKAPEGKTAPTTFPSWDKDGRKIRGYLDSNNQFVQVGGAEPLSPGSAPDLETFYDAYTGQERKGYFSYEGGEWVMNTFGGEKAAKMPVDPEFVKLQKALKLAVEIGDKDAVKQLKAKIEKEVSWAPESSHPLVKLQSAYDTAFKAKDTKRVREIQAAINKMGAGGRHVANWELTGPDGSGTGEIVRSTDGETYLDGGGNARPLGNAILLGRETGAQHIKALDSQKAALKRLAGEEFKHDSEDVIMRRSMINYTYGTGLGSWWTSIANGAAAAFGGGQIFPENDKAINALDNLAVRTKTIAQAEIAGRPSTHIMEMLDKIVVHPMSITQGDEGAMNRLMQTRDMLFDDRVRIDTTYLSKATLFKPDVIGEAEGKRARLQDLIYEYDTVIKSFVAEFAKVKPAAPAAPPRAHPQDVQDIIKLYRR